MTHRNQTTGTHPAILQLGDQRSSSWSGRSVVSVKQFERHDLEEILSVAHEMREVVTRIGTWDLLKGKILANLFYEPSTRTSSSFIAAMQRLGGAVIPITGVQFSSVAKGESLPDTVRTLGAYADVVVLRHPEVGSSLLASRYAGCPVINAGDGIGEHPTQALLDLFTITEELGQPDGLTVTLLGDLKFGRTVHSLARVLSLYDVKLRLVSPAQLPMPEEILAELRGKGVEFTSHTSLDDVLAETDVLYVTRVQKERFDDLVLYEELKHAFSITAETMAGAKARTILMHPFPRVGEISMDVDDDPRAVYFKQMRYGMYVRMALLAMVLGKV